LGLSRSAGAPTFIVVDRDRPHLATGPDPYSTLVYAARGSDVRTTIVDGDVLVDQFSPVSVDREEIAAQARRRGARARLTRRAAGVGDCCIIISSHKLRVLRSGLGKVQKDGPPKGGHYDGAS